MAEWRLGAQKLKSLREQRQVTQLTLDLEGVISQKQLSSIETGKTQRPERETLEDLLDFYEVSFNERQEILKAYSYLPSNPLVTTEEIEAALAQCQPIFDQVSVPAYVVDRITTSLLATNRYFAKLLGDCQDELDRLIGKPLFMSQFEIGLQMKGELENIEEYLLQDVQSIRERLNPYKAESWYEPFIAELCANSVFQEYWTAAAALPPLTSEPDTFAARILYPVSFLLPGSDAVLEFDANPENLPDDRLVMTCLTPRDAFTLRTLERWRSEMHDETQFLA